MHVSSLADMAASPQDIRDVGCTTCGDMVTVQRTGVAGLAGLDPNVQRIAVIAAVAAVIYMVVR